MIVIGSFALSLLGQRDPGKVRDLDFVGTDDDVALFRSSNSEIIKSEQTLHVHRHIFTLVDGHQFDKIEIDTEQSESDRMLPALCKQSVEMLGMTVDFPPTEVLYLIKRAHANVAIHYEKTIRDILQLKPLIGKFNDTQLTFYKMRKHECLERFNLNRQRFRLAIRNEDFFDTSDHIRYYVHDDMHEVVAHYEEGPIYKRCKHDPSLAKIDTDLFEQLGHEDQLRMVREEFMVIGLERYFFHNRTLNAPQVYELGMHKTVRDLFVGYFQDFCIDHIDELVTPPPFDFVGRFVKAEREGRLRQVEIQIDPPTETHNKIWQLIEAKDFNQARQMSEDLIRRSEHGPDTHAYFLLGITLLHTKDFEFAEKCLRMCVMRDKKNAIAWFYFGSTLRLTGRFQEAVKALLQAAGLGYRKFPLLWNLGLAYEALALKDKAIAAYRQAHKIQINDSRPAAKLAALGAPVE